MEAARILTVEDDPIVQTDLRLILEDAGYVVCSTARDGIEAVEQARAHRPDLIVMDIGLPRLDGAAATKRILDERDVPVIALTGRNDAEALDRATAAGATRHILKPFHVGELVYTLADVLAERQGRLQHEAEQQCLRVMIEWMLRQGCSEREIVAAVKRETGGSTEAHEPARVMEHLGRLARRILGAPRH